MRSDNLNLRNYDGPRPDDFAWVIAQMREMARKPPPPPKAA